MPAQVGVEEAARQLGVNSSRVRALIADGGLQANKIGGRWLIEWDSVLARQRATAAGGRPLTAQNAWALLLAASGEGLPAHFDAHSRWRTRQTLGRQPLRELRSKLDRRAQAHYLWTLPGELRRLRDSEGVVRSGSSAAGELGLQLLAPDTLDAYVPESRFDALTSEYGLEPASLREANVILRAVPDQAWVLEGKQVAPPAAVGIDLAGYPDSRSARVGSTLLAELDARRGQDR